MNTRTLYAVWGAIGLSILVEFGLLLFLQRTGRLAIAVEAGGPGGEIQVALAIALFAVAAVVIGILRLRARTAGRLLGETGGPASGGGGQASWDQDADEEPDATGRAALSRFVAVSVLAWAVAEAFALVGFALALALAPLPRAAITIYFTGALLLWLWSRPPMGVVLEPRRGAARPR